MLIPLRSIIHTISYALLAPTILILLLFIVLVVAELGSLLVEAVTERRRRRVDVAALLSAFQGGDAGRIRNEIAGSGLSRRQKMALETVIAHADLLPASLRALARQVLSGEELHYARITAGTDLVARLGPMFGLMATLIPLGPGLIALGQGDTKTLAASLLTAFDATVSGLAAAGVAFAVSRLRKRWYESCLSILEALLEGLLEVFARGRGIAE
jgi:biopolymer transport protein ExbB/TolQ